MADDTPIAGTQAQASSGSSLVVPGEVRQEFPELIELIIHSESMNDEERQYWVNILPIMTPDQVKNLKDILTNEREQLAAIDAKYAKQGSKEDDEAMIRRIEEDRQKKKQERSSTETVAKQEEEDHTEDLLKEIQNT